MSYTNDLTDILRALESGMDPGTAYGFFQDEQEQHRAQMQARREAKMAKAQAMQEQQDALISALSGTAMSSASQGSSLSDVLAELAAQSSFMGVQPNQAFADPRLEAGLRELYPPSQVPYAPGVTPPLVPDARTSLRSVIAPAPTISADYKNKLIEDSRDAALEGASSDEIHAAMLARLSRDFGAEGAEMILKNLDI